MSTYLTKKSITRDVEVQNAPTDTVSQLSFSPNSNMFSASSWDKSVRIYEANETGNTRGVAMYNHDAPALCTKFSPDGTKVASGGADCYARIHDLQTNTQRIVAQHDSPISCLAWVSPEILATGSWDKTIKYWDLKKQTPIGVINLPAKVISMDVAHPLLTAALSNNEIACVNLENPFILAAQPKVALKNPVTCVAAITQPKLGFIYGCLDGKLGIQYVDQAQRMSTKADEFAFKGAHRESTKTYSVNSVYASKVSGVTVSCGGDGTYAFWNTLTKSKISYYTVPTYQPGTGPGAVSIPTPITALDVNNNGSLVVYATGYDWNRGYKFHSKNSECKIRLHMIEQGDLPKK